MSPEAEGPLERIEFATRLRARVVTPGAAPAVHGYDVEGDLARSYSFAELILLSLTGEPPSREKGRAFEVALAFLAPVSVAEAPAHAAGLARLCDGTPSAVVATAAIALTEQGRVLLDDHAPLLAWLESPSGPCPPAFLSDDAAELSSVGRLRDRLAEAPYAVSALDLPLTREAALLAVLHACGLVRRDLVEAALVVARLPAVAAEAFAVTPLAVRDYPTTTLPTFEYRPDRREPTP